VNLFKRYRDELVAIVLLALPFFFLRANLSEPERASYLDRILLRFSAPFQWAAVKVAAGVSSGIEEYVYLVDVQRENERLGYENARLVQEVRDLEQVERENERLRSLLVLRDQIEGEKVSARVIAKDMSPLFRVIRIRIDRGRDDRIVQGMPVVSTEGLVGQISRVEDRYADVMLTIDESSAVDVVVQRTGSRGMLAGTGETDNYKSRIQYLLRADEVRVGDTVVTSGLGKRFPPNLKVGTISNVEKRDFDLYQLAEVTPAVNFTRLEEVFVLIEGAREASTLVNGRGPDPAAARTSASAGRP
jgi:rod shape-determining protein MreC